MAHWSKQHPQEIERQRWTIILTKIQLRIVGDRLLKATAFMKKIYGLQWTKKLTLNSLSHKKLVTTGGIFGLRGNMFSITNPALSWKRKQRRVQACNTSLSSNSMAASPACPSKLGWYRRRAVSRNRQRHCRHTDRGVCFVHLVLAYGWSM